MDQCTVDILDSITDAFFVLNHEWRYVYINERALEQIRRTKGEELTRADLLGKNTWELYPEFVRTRFYEELDRALRERMTVEFEGYFPLSDKWFEVRAYPSDAGLLVYSHDITERKRSEERHFRYALLEENAYDAFIATDERLVVTAWNTGAEKMYGVGAEEALGRDAREVVSLEMGDEELAEVLREIEDTGRLRVEQVQHREDGTPIHVDSLTIAMRDERGETTGYLAINRDISERKRLDEEHRRLAAIVQNSSDFIGIADLDWRSTFLNEAGQRLVGLESNEEVLRTRVADYFTPKDRVFLEETVVPVVLEEGRWRGELNLRHFKTGEAIPALWDGFRVDDPDTGEPIGLATVTRDLAEIKRAEERLEEVREDERRRMARDLHDETLQDLADAIAQAQLMRANPEEAAVRLGRLSDALKRAERQVRGAVYDLRMGGEQDKPFGELLEDLVELHRELAQDIRISLDVADGALFDPLGETGRELLRIIGEALTNARRHSGAANVQVSVRSSGGRLRAEISDDGRGIDPAGSSSTASVGGTGTKGMRERARRAGASLDLMSEPGEGTTVRFEVVLKEDPERSEWVARVLLVEDHVTVRDAVASAVGLEADFEVAGLAGSLSEARTILEADPGFDVAVVDLGLPDGYGGDLITELREANPQAQALVLSASVDRAEIARAIEAGAAGVINKTAHLDEVVDAVRRLRAGETLMPLEEVVDLLRFAGEQREHYYEARQAATNLTPREREVLQALALGLDSKGIAERLHISLRTERNHMANILSKLGVHSQLQALLFALHHGLAKIP